MQIRITDSSKSDDIRELAIVDRKSGQEYTADMIARDPDLPAFDGQEGVQPMTAEQYTWWHDVLIHLQVAEDRYASLCGELHGDEYVKISEEYAEAGSACDLEDLPAAVWRVCDTFEFRHLTDGRTRQEVAVFLGLSIQAVDKRRSGESRVRSGELVALRTLTTNPSITYRITACYERDGQVIDCTQPEVLGEYYGKTFSTLEDAKEAVDELRDGIEDYELDPSTEFEIVRG